MQTKQELDELAKGGPYQMGAGAASMLKGIVSLPSDMRRELVAEWAKREGAETVIQAFADFIGLSVSVVENSHSFLEVAAIVDGGLHPHEAERINFPTIFGALEGVDLAKFGCEKMCGGCAFRIGSHANQSAATTLDARWTSAPGEQAFMCHEELDDLGQPVRACAGWAKARKATARQHIGDDR